MSEIIIIWKPAISCMHISNKDPYVLNKMLRVKFFNLLKSIIVHASFLPNLELSCFCLVFTINSTDSVWKGSMVSDSIETRAGQTFSYII